jgi:IS30 family transposase
MQSSTKTRREKQMEQINYSQKKKHLTVGERANIELLMKEKVKPSEIARRIGRHRSVISREIKRNSIKQMDSELRVQNKYYEDAATRQYKERRKRTGRKIKLIKAKEMIEYVERQIKSPEKWSPDAAIGRAKLEHPEWESISTKTFYNYIELGLVRIKPIDLLLKTKLRPKKKRNKKRKKILGKSITERPIEANDRQEFGHWEMDTVIGKREKSSVLLTLTERKTGYEIIRKVSGKSPKDIKPALKKIKTEYDVTSESIFKTCTVDNGSEFSDSDAMESALGTLIYYANPYSSYERGTNENHNGIIRRFIPKGKSIDDIPDSFVKRVEYYMNNLPRKRFGYQTPLEYMAKLLQTG